MDGGVRALGYTYTGLGLPYLQTSYSDSAATTVVSQVRDDYNARGQLKTQYQEHSGVVNTGSSAFVHYSYSSGSNHSRLSAEIYPNGRTLNYMYISELDCDVSRLSEMDDTAGTGAGGVEAYKRFTPTQRFLPRGRGP